MKIEKLNDNQIRCTLNHSDLHARSLSVKDLAYGSPRARELFHEMMERADAEFGFHPEGAPLMVEAIPLSGDSIMLIISQIEDPDELDTRFARFAPGIEEDSSDSAPEHEIHSLTSDLLDSLKSLLEDSVEEEKAPAGAVPVPQDQASPAEEKKEDPSPRKVAHLPIIYQFTNLPDVMKAASVLCSFYRGHNSLYRDDKLHLFFLVMHRTDHTPEEFNKICNVMNEYSQRIRTTVGTESYFKEHLTCMIRDHAIQSLGSRA